MEKKRNRKRKKSGGMDSILFVRNIPPEIKRFYKAHCVKRGKTMSECIINHMRQTVKEMRELEGELK